MGGDGDEEVGGVRVRRRDDPMPSQVPGTWGDEEVVKTQEGVGDLWEEETRSQ